MKRLAVILLAVVCSVAALAEKPAYKGKIYASLNRVTVAGTGHAYAISSATPASSVTWQVLYNGTPLSSSVNLEGSIDGVNYFVLDSTASTASEMRHIINKPVLYVRCNATALTGNTSTLTCSFVVNN
jgi:hypothetical protein